METAADTLEIVLDDDKEPKTPEIVVEHAEKAAPDVSEAIADLRRQLEEAQTAKTQAETARLDAERRARESAQQVHKAQNEVENTNLRLIDSAIETIKGNGAALKAKLKEAWSAGDTDLAADVQEAMATNAAKLMQLESGKASLEAAPKRVAPVENDPVEALASKLSPRSAQWIRAHPEYATDQRLYNKMVAAHGLVRADGIVEDTDEYFAAIEDTLKMRKPAVIETQEPISEAAAPTQRRQSPQSAPVSRGAVNGTRAGVVRLTAEEREIAAMNKMTDEEYAREKIALQKAGRLN